MFSLIDKAENEKEKHLLMKACNTVSKPWNRAKWKCCNFEAILISGTI